MGPYFDMTLKNTYENEAVNDAKATMSYSETITVLITCTPDKSDKGVGLFQWTVGSPGLASLSNVYTKHTVCRYGSEWQTTPQCPWNACLDASCSSCAEDCKAD